MKKLINCPSKPTFSEVIIFLAEALNIKDFFLCGQVSMFYWPDHIGKYLLHNTKTYNARGYNAST